MKWPGVTIVGGLLALGCGDTSLDEPPGGTGTSTGGGRTVDSASTGGDSTAADRSTTASEPPAPSEGTDASDSGSPPPTVGCEPDQVGPQGAWAGVVGPGRSAGAGSGTLAAQTCTVAGMELSDTWDAVDLECEGRGYGLIAGNAHVLLPDTLLAVGDTVVVDAGWDEDSSSPHAWFVMADAEGAMLWGGATGLPVSPGIVDQAWPLQGGDTMVLGLVPTDCDAQSGPCGDALVSAAVSVGSAAGEQVVHSGHLGSVGGNTIHVGVARLAEFGSTPIDCADDHAERLDVVFAR